MFSVGWLAVYYKARFTASGQTITALVDVTTASGGGARSMNLMQAVVDSVAVVTQLPAGTPFKFGYEVYPDLLETIASLEHLNRAAHALLNVPPNGAEFRRELELARQRGEFDLLADKLEKLGMKGVKEKLKSLGGAAAGLADSIIRNYTSVLTILATDQVAGFVIFESR
jgi:hypothetical protein